MIITSPLHAEDFRVHNDHLHYKSVPDLADRWQDLTGSAASADRIEGVAHRIPGFEPFNDPQIALSDGRVIVRGRWDGDEIIASWSRRNPDLTREIYVAPIPPA